ncbi:MAG TPA: glycoside hydrolase family 15 protein, partial [Nitrospiraceae bacterium]|nr:glycoside hydrolase family 15 protein [Nitrospiraceae bacterium]
VPYPAIEKHGMIGDRRTVALVAADGTIDWWCAPNFDDPPVFGALLDPAKGGFCRLGPAALEFGRQAYGDDSGILITRWTSASFELELIDCMAWPQNDRSREEEPQRILIRKLRCVRGSADCLFVIHPRFDFEETDIQPADGGLVFQTGRDQIHVWSSINVQVQRSGASHAMTLKQGQEFWAVLSMGRPPGPWSSKQLSDVLYKTMEYWKHCMAGLAYSGPCMRDVRRSALLIHLSTFAPAGSVVAAPTTSLPERLGGDLNYDYRFAWIRDASLAMAMMALAGDTRSASYFMGWLARRDSATDSPLQIMYRLSGETDVSEHERKELRGYRGSIPVRIGNHAYTQRQLDSLGYLIGCAFIYLVHGGEWYEECWQTVRRAAEYTAANWQKPDSGIWELSQLKHYVSSKVMSWVALDRALKIAERIGRLEGTDHWAAARDAIHTEVMERGWSDALRSFRQRYDDDTLDASALLIPVMDFLPATHPRVQATLDAIEEHLTINGLVYRFHPSHTLEQDDLLLGEFEGAFLPCTFWLATSFAKAGRLDKAEAIVKRAEQTAGEVGLFAEEVDARSGGFLGNYPLVFSQAEYLRTLLALAEGRRIS